MFFRRTLLIILPVMISGCATVSGPQVSQKEIQQATAELQVKALDFRIKEIKRVNAIGYRIARSIYQEDIKTKPRAFTGIFCVERTKVVDSLFHITATGSKMPRGVVIIFVLENTPAFDAGLKPGDLMLAIDKKDMVHYGPGFENSLKPGQTILLTVLRNHERWELPLRVEQMPVGVNFTVVDDQSVNASAGTNQIFVTYGLLNFAKTDDEIAAVIGHELGHLSRGHVHRMTGGNVVSFIAAIGLGVTSEVFAPGTGSAVMRGVGGVGNVFKANFSRDLEREADYFGVKYVYDAGYDPQACVTVHERFAIEIPASMTKAFFSTHPSSPERKVRIEKTIEELKNRKAHQETKS